MFTIKKIRAHHVIDFAAQELKKYLRMMMPESGDVPIVYDPEAKDGFRLGLLEDFGLDNEAADPVLDDVIHVDTDSEGGILAGSNPRSVLFAVYRLLKCSGCRWLYPGIDGEYVPMVDGLEPVYVHKLADHRFRGFCNEGSESQTAMLECADYYAKLEMNVYMLEWFVPNGYYNRYYTHQHNTANRIPEPVDDRQILQWKRQTEVEIAKRGLMFHDIGHGWTSRPFGFPCNNSVNNKADESVVYTEEQKSVLAMLNGKRDFFRGMPIYTNVCMSRADVREAMANEVAEYARTHANIDYLHVWLSDGSFNHCECAECQKMRPADWYMMVLNLIDEKLTALGLDTRIVFIAYLDTIFAPEQVFINNPARFSLLYAPITRSYTQSMGPDTPPCPIQPYVRNKWERPTGAGATLAYLRSWQQVWKGPALSYEYHFWRHQFLDPGGMALARRLYEDVRALNFAGLDGYVQDGSQRSGFPNAFPIYVYAATLMDREVDYEALKEDYFSHIYGPDWKWAVRLLEQITDGFDHGYMEGECSEDTSVSPYYAPSRVEQLSRIHDIAAQLRAQAQKHLTMPTRPQTVSWRLLLRHAEYVEKWAQIMIEKALGNNFRAQELAKAFCDDFGRYELEMERYYDHSLACRVTEHITRKPQGIILD